MKNSAPLAFAMSLTSGLVQSSLFGSLAEATISFNKATKNDSISQSFNSSVFSTPSVFPNFIRPSINPTAECNLWGLLCQTGLITVGVNLTTTVTTTTVPCSYYLLAQAKSADLAYQPGDLNIHLLRPEAGYLSSFGHSPECSVYANDLRAHPVVDGWDGRTVGTDVLNSEDDARRSAFQFSKCGSQDETDPRVYTPPGVTMTNMGGPFEDFYCCGACTLKVPEIRLWYFPDSSTYSCLGDSANATSRNRLSSNHISLNKRIESLLNGSTLITDGYTLTSPSFYLEMVGTASMQDSCGHVGSIYTNALVPVPKDGLSTISLNLSIGANFMNREFGRREIASYTKQVRIEDLICPTWGLMNGDPDDMATVGSPFFPIIHPPSELLSFDRAWSRCSEYVTAEIQGGYLPYEVFDPPHMLVPASALAPATNPVNVVTSLDPKPTIETPPKANPVDSRTPELPSITKKPLPSDPGPKPAPAGNSRNSDPKESTHPVDQINPSGVDHDATDPDSTSESIGNQNQQGSPGIGALIFSAFGAPRVPEPSVKNGGGGTVASSTRDSPPLVLAEGESTFTIVPSAVIPSTSVEPSEFGTGGDGYFTFAGQVFTTHLSDILVDGSTIIPNGIGITKSGTVMKLDSGGNLMVDKSTVKIVNFDPTPPPSTYTMNGQIHSGNPSFMIVGDKTLRPGGSSITVSGTLLRLNSGGELVVDANTLQLANFLPTPLPSVTVYTVNGQTLTGNPSFLAVDGKTLTPGGGAITISGTRLSLGSGGNLVVDSSTVKLASVVPTPLPSVYTVHGQTLTGDPSFLAVDGKTLTPGGDAITISGTLFSLDSGGNLIVDSSTVKLASVLQTPLPSVYNVNGQKLTGNPSFLAVGGKTITPGGDAVAISGTILRLNSGGNLVVDSSTVRLASVVPMPLPSVYTVNGQLFTGNPSFLAVGGKLMTAGGAAITISGTPVSLEPSGSLRFGTEDIPLATHDSSLGSVNGSIAPATFLGGQDQVQATKKKTVWLGLLIVGVLIMQ